jgi:membrane-bound lytic murein transglycosylase F
MLNRLLVNNYYKIIISLVLLFYTISCIPIWEKINSVSLQDIQNRKKLKVIASYNQNTYYIYREQEMGFEFELIKLFCKEIGVELEITTTKDLDNLPFMLNSTDNDLVMGNLLVNRKKARELSYTEHLQTSRMVLVQRSKLYAKKEVYINNVVQLIGKKIYLRKKSSYYSKIKSLQEELGGKIDIEVVEGDISTEELIEKVSNGEIDYTISDEPTAQISMTYYNNLDSAVVVSFPQKISWIVRRNSPELLREMNKWILKIRSDGTLDKIKTKYYLSSRYTNSDNQVITYLKQSENKSNSGGRISPYDKIFQVESEKLGWDWRLLAALCYTESKFNPEAKSWAGAVGLMQLMPSTAMSLGMSREEFYIPENNIKVGVRHLIWLDKYWEKIKNKEERTKFVIASYNAGQGHILDARQITQLKNKNPDIWDGHVSEAILQLSSPDVFNQSYVKYGYCRGREPYNYVSNIYKKFKEYKEI